MELPSAGSKVISLPAMPESAWGAFTTSSTSTTAVPASGGTLAMVAAFSRRTVPRKMNPDCPAQSRRAERSLAVAIHNLLQGKQILRDGAATGASALETVPSLLHGARPPPQARQLARAGCPPLTSRRHLLSSSRNP